MTAEARAFLLKAIHMNNQDDTRVLTLVNEFINKVRVNPTTVYFEDMNINSMDWIFYSTVRSTAIAMDALLQVGHDFPFYEQIVSWFMQKRQNGHWQNTQENFYVLQALNAYFIKYESNEPDFNANIAIGDQTVIKRTFSGFSREVEKVKIPFSNLTAKALDVNVNKSGTGSLYYGMRMTYYPTEPVIPREQGITLLKTVLPVDSDRNQIRLGDLVKIELKVVLNKQSHYLVVSDPLAAGLEPVNLSLSGTQYTIPGQSLQQDWSGFSHVEMRMDRVVLFANQLDPGIHTYTYYARAITPGAFMMPSTYSEQMYTPEVYGRTKDRIIEIR
jgi:hypothetical protein